MSYIDLITETLCQERPSVDSDSRIDWDGIAYAFIHNLKEADPAFDEEKFKLDIGFEDPCKEGEP